MSEAKCINCEVRPIANPRTCQCRTCDRKAAVSQAALAVAAGVEPYLARLAGRCTNGFERDGGKVVHAVVKTEYAGRVALCGATPGRLSAGWDTQVVSGVTCRGCSRRVAKAETR